MKHIKAMTESEINRIRVTVAEACSDKNWENYTVDATNIYYKGVVAGTYKYHAFFDLDCFKEKLTVVPKEPLKYIFCSYTINTKE